MTTATCKTMISTMIALITVEKSLSSKLSSSYESKPVVRLTVVDEGQPERRQNRRKQGELKAELSMECCSLQLQERLTKSTTDSRLKIDKISSLCFFHPWPSLSVTCHSLLQFLL